MPGKGNKVGVLELFLILVDHIDELWVGVANSSVLVVVICICEIASTFLAISRAGETGYTQV